MTLVGKSNTVGLIGLGLLGSALAKRLMAQGRNVRGYDQNSAAISSFVAAGGCAVVRPEELANAADPLLLCLPDSDVVEQVVQGILPCLPSGQLVIDTTTGSPQQTRDLAGQLLNRNIHLMDVSVLGSSQETLVGRSVLMVGADTDMFQRSAELLAAISDQVYHIGPVGSGQQMKLVANLVLGLNRAALAEGLYFARQCNLDLHSVLEVLKAGATYSRVMDTKGVRMITEDFVPQARLSQHLKDVRLILQQADSLATTLPLSEQHQRLLESAENRGCGVLDNSAIIRAWGDAV